MHRVIFVFCALVVIGGWTQTTNVFNRCVHSGGQPPRHVVVHGCFAPPCSVAQLQNLVVDVFFVAPRNTSQMTTQVTLSINAGSIQINTPINLGTSSRTCDFTWPACPVQESEVVHYRFVMRVEQYFAASSPQCSQMCVKPTKSRLTSVVDYGLNPSHSERRPSSLANYEIRVVDNDFNNAVIWCIGLPIQILDPLA